MRALLLTGNYAAAYAVREAQPDVISAYPITPQTTVIEKLADFIDAGELKAKFVRVESEHSAMAALIGAASVGARTYTATSSHGLLYMYEVVWWAAGARLPIVMGLVTRAIGPPWNIWSDHADFYTLRDSGWNLLFASNAQEVYDFTLLAYMLSENPRVSLPTAVAWDAFEVSHTYEPVQLIERAPDLLPPKGAWKPPLSFEDPASLGNLAYPEEYLKIRKAMKLAALEALKVFRDAAAKLGEVSGRDYSRGFECYRCDDAHMVFVVMGSIFGEVVGAVDTLRREGQRVGALKLWLYRPFPYESLAEALKGKERVVVISRSSALGAASPLAADVATALQLRNVAAALVDISAGVGGADVTAGDVINMYKLAEKGSGVFFWQVER
ncbi:MAG: hypothetical protein QXU72_05125 [Thermofilum sp.]